MVVAASDNDASRIQRLTAMVKNQGVQLAPGWRSQISEAPSGRFGVFISPKGARLKGYKDVLRHLGLPTESQLPAVSPVDNSEQIGSDNAHSTDTATATVQELSSQRTLSPLRALTCLDSMSKEDLPQQLHKIPITCNGEPGDFHMYGCKVECSCPSCSNNEAPSCFWSRTGPAGFQKHSGLSMNGNWKRTFLVDVPEYVDKTLEEYLRLHGYCFGSKPGRSPLQPRAVRPAASSPVSSVHSEYEPDALLNQGGASPLAQPNSITDEGCSRPTKRHCTRLTRHSTGAVPTPSLSRAAVEDKQAQDDTAIASGTSQSQNGNAKAPLDTAKAYMSSAPCTPQALSTKADSMRLRQQEIQLKSLQGVVDKQAEELHSYKQLMQEYQQQMTQKDQFIRAKDEQLADVRAQQQERAKLLADAQQELQSKEHLLASITNNQAEAVTDHDMSEWVSRNTHEKCLAAVHATAQEALSTALQNSNAESYKNLELQMQLAAR